MSASTQFVHNCTVTIITILQLSLDNDLTDWILAWLTDGCSDNQCSTKIIN